MSNVSFPLFDVRFSSSYVRYQLSNIDFNFPSSSVSFPLSSASLTWPNVIFPSFNVSFQGGVIIGFSCTGKSRFILPEKSDCQPLFLKKQGT